MPKKRDYEAAPVSAQLGLEGVILGLIGDLEQLRNREISTNDAIARANLAKQIFNGVRLYLAGEKYLTANAKSASPALPSETQG